MTPQNTLTCGHPHRIPSPHNKNIKCTTTTKLHQTTRRSILPRKHATDKAGDQFP